MLNASIALSLAMLAGRLAGLLRELMLGTMFGVSVDADMAVLLLTLPDLLVNLLIAGGLSAALVPRLSVLRGNDALALVRQVSFGALAVFGVAGLLVLAWPQAIFQLFAPGLDISFEAGAVGLAAVGIALPLTAGAGVAGAYLNANNRYFVTGCGTLIFNVGVLVALYFASTSADPLTVLAIGIAGGAALRWGAQLLIMPPQVWYAKASAPVVDRALAQAFTAAALATALMLLAPVLVRAIASTLGPGVISSFNYAQKLVELPTGILITSISTVALARLSSLHANRLGDQVVASAVRDTQYAVLIAAAIAGLGYWFADSVVQILFGRGAMDSDALNRVSLLTKVALLGLPFIAISSMATAHLSATNQTSKILKPTLASLLLLPLLAAPGLYWSSELALMSAVVVFHAVVALGLVLTSRLPMCGGSGVFSAAAWQPFAVILMLGFLAAALDWALNLQNHLTRLLLAGAGFALAMAQVRRFLTSRPLPQIVPTP